MKVWQLSLLDENRVLSPRADSSSSADLWRMEMARSLKVTLIPSSCFEGQASLSAEHLVLRLLSVFGTGKGTITLLLIQFVVFKWRTFTNWTKQVLCKHRDMALANGCHSVRPPQQAHESPKGLQMHRLMDVWTDEDGGVYIWRESKILCYSQNQNKIRLFMSNYIFPAV